MRQAKRSIQKLTTLTTLAILAGSAVISAGKGRPDFVATGQRLPGEKIPEHARGPEVIERLGERLPEVARWHGASAEDFRAMVNHDHSIHIDENDDIYYVCDGLDVSDTLTIDTASTSFSTSSGYDAFNLSSFPGAPLTIYLDFDGAVTSGTPWNNYLGGADIVTPAYDTDGNPSSFSAGELNNIIEIWKRVAEDYAPWQVNVTTVDPGSAALSKSSSSDTTYGIRVVIGGSSYDWYGKAAGGTAYLGSFTWNSDVPCWVFEAQLGNGAVKYTAEAISHEAGHTFSLFHDGTSTEAYYSGHGNWAPIMGVGYNREIVQWSKGEYANANNTEDDIQKISSVLPFRNDTAGDDITTDAILGIQPVVGVIENSLDCDIYTFQTDGGTVSLAAENVNGGNLDILIALYDGRGSLVASADPLTSLNASLVTTLRAGTYYVCVEGTAPGNPDTSYTEYGSLGQYRLTGVFATSQNAAPVASATTSSPTKGLAPLSITFSGAGSYDPDGSIVSYDWAFGNGSTSTSISPNHVYNTPGVYTATLVVVDDKGASSSDSIVITVTEPLPPVADASRSGPLSGTAPLTVTLDGTASGDPDGQITSYSWISSNGASGSGSLASMTFSNPGTYTVTLQVIDTDGYGDTDTLTVQVNEPQTSTPNPGLEPLYVKSVDLVIDGNDKKGFVGLATVVIVDSQGQGVRNATVYGRFTGVVNEAYSTTTKPAGDASFRSSKYRDSGSLFFEVTDIVLEGYNFVP